MKAVVLLRSDLSLDLLASWASRDALSAAGVCFARSSHLVFDRMDGGRGQGKEKVASELPHSESEQSHASAELVIPVRH